MNRDDIHIGRTYTDGKGAYRRTIAATEFWPIRNQMDQDCLTYRMARLRSDGKLSGRMHELSCTRVSLAAWAKAEVTDGEVPDVVMRALHP